MVVGEKNPRNASRGVRFSNEILGVQFHPEADPGGMLVHFKDATRKASIIEQHGLKKYEAMIQHLQEEDKIPLTHQSILPKFLSKAVEHTIPSYSCWWILLFHCEQIALAIQKDRFKHDSQN